MLSYNNEMDIKVPAFVVPDGFGCAKDYLKHLAYEGAQSHYGQLLNEAIIARLEYELKKIVEMDLADYFLIVADCVRYARRQEAMIDADMSLSSGSLVAYCLGVTTIDPVKYGLLFERFICQSSSYLPHIVLNVCSFSKDQVLKYASDKYGDSNLLQQFDLADRTVRGFSIIYCTLLRIKDSKGIDMDIYSIPVDDYDTLKSLFDNSVKNSTFNLLLLANTVNEPLFPEDFRALAFQGDHQNYHSISEISDYLGETNGMIVFQEQIMWLSQLLAGFTPYESDQLRCALGKRSPTLLNVFRNKFISQSVGRGYSKSAMENLWENMNICHRISKTIMLGDAFIEYREKYLEIHYPVEYSKGKADFYRTYKGPY